MTNREKSAPRFCGFRSSVPSRKLFCLSECRFQMWCEVKHLLYFLSVFSAVINACMLAKQHTISGQLSTSAVLKHHFFPLNTSICVWSVSHHSSRQQLHCMKFSIEQWKLYLSKRWVLLIFLFVCFSLSHILGLVFSPKANHRKNASFWYSSYKGVHPEVN